MRIPSAPRRTGARNKPVHFTYVGVETGPPTEAYIAGPTWWGALHMSRPSKPCVYELTGGKIACRFCAVGKHRVAVTKGWVPLYRKIDTLAWMVPVDEAQRDVIDALPTFAKVLVGRGRGKAIGVWVQPALNKEPVWSSTLPERSVEADVTISLMTVWAVPEVTSFFSFASDNAVSLEREGNFEVTRECIDPTTKPAAGASGEYVVPGAAKKVPVDDAVRRVMARAKLFTPSTNGDHDAV